MCGPNGFFQDDETTVVEFVDDMNVMSAIVSDIINGGTESSGVQTVQVDRVGPISFDDFVAQSNDVLDAAGLTNPTDRNTTLTVAMLVKGTLSQWIGNAPADVIAQVGSVDKLGLAIIEIMALSVEANINGVNETSPSGFLN